MVLMMGAILFLLVPVDPPKEVKIVKTKHELGRNGHMKVGKRGGED